MPPNGVHQGMVMGGGPQKPQQQGAPQGPGFSQMGGGRPPSRTNTPQMQPGMMVNQSPSMGNRQIVGGAEMAINNDFARLQPAHIHQAKLEVGIPVDKDSSALNLNEKVGTSLDITRLSSDSPSANDPRIL